jgi:hypothetical protein
LPATRAATERAPAGHVPISIEESGSEESGGSMGPEEPDTEEVDIPDELPELDLDDPDVLMGEGSDYSEWLDTDRLAWSAQDAEVDDELTGYIDVGLTLDLDGADSGEELVQLMDLDVGALLTSLPLESTELDLDALAEFSGTFGVGALRDLLLPEGAGGSEFDELPGDMDDEERFPVFEESAIVLPRAPRAHESDADAALDDDVSDGPDDSR